MLKKLPKNQEQNSYLVKNHHLRTALKRYLLAEYSNDPDTLVVDELGVLHGAVRIDTVVINGILHGYELKSDKDTLERLPEQTKVYSSVFDRLTLVVGYRHAYEAIKNMPEWWANQIIKTQNS